MTENSKKPAAGADYSATLYLPKTDFPMRGGLPKREPDQLDHWQKIGLYDQLRRDSAAKTPFILHDGPPYANGHIHIGHALNKILKDTICRSQQMQGYNANFVPGWDCHGLPIEWKVEEQYRAKGKNKDEVPVNEFRRECREFAKDWIKIQAAEFQRLGVLGDFTNPYKTMNYDSEARIAAELLKFAASGQLYRGSKPIMWSVVERTALAEAEVEYYDLESEAIWVKFPIAETKSADLRHAYVVIWTTTPWTIPANRAVCYAPDIAYGLYEVAAAENDFGPQKGEHLLFADALAEACAQKAKLELKRLRTVSADELAAMTLRHPLYGAFKGAQDKNGQVAYSFPVPLLAGSHVSADAGTGFVHTAPSHGREDFDAWNAARPQLAARGISAEIPFPVDDAGYYTADAPGLNSEIELGGKLMRPRVLDDKGKEGGANKAVIAALIGQNLLFARGRIKHSYPHSWRSKKPVIFRNTPQWFVAMDKDLGNGETLRDRVLKAIDKAGFLPLAGQNRLRSMVADRPDWVLSRQRVWGVPIAIFANDKGEILQNEAVNQRIIAAFEQEGADAWFAEGARERFLGAELARQDWQMVRDILDVWFDSGCSHAYVLEARDKSEAPQLAEAGKELRSPADIYLEGSDQHRGWFQSSLLESCGTRGHAPFKTIITHGFTLDGNGKKMSKSLGNVVSPQEIVDKYGADILRLWVMGTDYREDQRLSQDSIQTAVDTYRKLRNVIRWMLGTLSALKSENLAEAQFPELERYMLCRFAVVGGQVKSGYDAYDFKRVLRALLDFANLDLSAFYFDIRKDALYCDAPSSRRRIAALLVIKAIFERFITWAAPLLPFTAEEAWLDYQKQRGNIGADVSVHCEQFRSVPQEWHNAELAARWERIRNARRVITGALELARAEKKIGSSLEAAVQVYVSEKYMLADLRDLGAEELADICIVSGFALAEGRAPAGAFTLADVPDVAVVWQKAAGRKCARSWRWTTDIGAVAGYPDVSARDAEALIEKKKLGLI